MEPAHDPTLGRPAVFLDKDGTVVEDVPYNVDPARIRFAPGAERGLAAFHAAGFALVMISNQSGVSHGYFPEEALRAVERRVRSLLLDFGVPLAGFYYCPHHPRGKLSAYATECSCRKPRPGMILRAAYDLGLHPPSSWCIGDILDDVEAGRRAGCRTVLLDNGHETEWRRSPSRRPDVVATDLAEAASVILSAHLSSTAPNPPRFRSGPLHGSETPLPSSGLRSTAEEANHG
jgi:histidinol-phosphate phosphatase family protein